MAISKVKKRKDIKIPMEFGLLIMPEYGIENGTIHNEIKPTAASGVANPNNIDNSLLK